MSTLTEPEPGTGSNEPTLGLGVRPLSQPNDNSARSWISQPSSVSAVRARGDTALAWHRLAYGSLIGRDVGRPLHRVEGAEDRHAPVGEQSGRQAWSGQDPGCRPARMKMQQEA